MKTYTLDQITKAGHDSEDAEKVQALCEHLDCEPGELSKESYDCYGLDVYSFRSQEYAIGTDAGADKAVTENIQGSIWAFNPSFIVSMCGLPEQLEEGIKAMQEKCESANDALLALVEKQCGLPLFVEHAVMADGRGHSLSSYDGEENEVGEFFIYRIN